MAAILVIVAVVTLVLPWYPVVETQTVTQTFTYSYQIPSQSYQTQTVYTLPSPVQLQGLFQTGATFGQVYKDLGDVSLQSGWTVHVQVTECQYCNIGLSKDFGNNATVYSVQGSAQGNFIVPESGQYKIDIGNLGNTQEQVTAISVTADVPQNKTETQFGHNTVSVTSYSIVNIAPIGMVHSGVGNSMFFIALVIFGAALAIVLFTIVKRVKPETEVHTRGAKYCISCGSELKPESKFCAKCGTAQS